MKHPCRRVAVLDSERGQVIEAEGKGLRAAPLAEFMHRAHRVILMRPMRPAGTGCPLSSPPGDMHYWATILFDSGPVAAEK